MPFLLHVTSGRSCPRRRVQAVPAYEVMAAALIDRLLHHCHIVNIRGNSYRMRERQEMWPSIQASEA